ncbi:MAG TPA: tetratricopeptide repeat protein [Chloroflexota bacterium]|nr:tetratricopeptide repeat protein [Chloroflexota bacterium]
MATRLPPDTAHVTYSRQYRRCHRSGCGHCAEGKPGHGPYWFAYWRENGKVRSRYLGKTRPMGAPDAGEPAPSKAAPPSSALRVHTLGGLMVWRGSDLIPPGRWNRPAVRGLFTCLLSAPEQRVHREQVGELLWPDDPRATRKLNDTVRLLRQLLDEPEAGTSAVRVVGDILALEPAGESRLDGDWLDAVTFERSARAALGGKDRDICRTALALYGGPYLPDDPYAEWVAARRETLRGLYQETLRHLANLSGDAGDLEEAEHCLRRLLKEDPCHEDAAAALMGMLAAASRRAEALRVYQELAASLDADLGLAPCNEVEALRGQVLALAAAPSAADAPPRIPLPAPAGNLPASLTSFVGRIWERQEIRGLLLPSEPPEGPSSRFLTLAGPGGCGKTRLALEVAGTLAEAYPDGVWLVELAALSDDRLVPRVLAGALGLQERLKGISGDPLIAELIAFLGPRQTLVLLDNCEHLLAGCAELATVLLHGCPGLRMLATSREPLRIEGETVWRVPPLATPPSASTADLDSLRHYEAVQLFMDRGRANRRDFVLTPLNAPAVSRICRWLDGLPLAIELAAARLGVLPVETVAARLDDCFQVLTGGSRTALPRQRTLRATMDWSYNLLPEPERVLLRRLSIFAGGWQLDAAAAICWDAADDSVPSRAWGASTEDLLAELTARSLVQTTEYGGLGRYRLLETVRQYAREQLHAAGEAQALAKRHRRWFLEQLAQGRAEPRAAERTSWLNLLEDDIDNLRVVLSSNGMEPEEREHVLHLAEPLAHFCLLRGYQAEGRQWLAAALAHQGASATRAGALNAAGTLANEQGDYPAASALYAESLALYRERGDARGMARLVINLGTISKFQGDLEQARARYAEGLAIVRTLADTTLLALVLNNLGTVAIDLGDNERAAAVLEESLALKRQAGTSDGLIVTLINLGEVARALGDLDRAASLGEEALALAASINARRHTAHAHYNLGLVARARGKEDQAATAFRASLLIEQELGNKRQIASILEGLAGLAAARGENRRAGRLFGVAEHLREQLGAPIPPTDRPSYDRDTAAVRSRLSPLDAKAAWLAGRALPLEAAIGEALDDHAPSQTTL